MCGSLRDLLLRELLSREHKRLGSAGGSDMVLLKCWLSPEVALAVQKVWSRYCIFADQCRPIGQSWRAWLRPVPDDNGEHHLPAHTISLACSKGKCDIHKCDPCSAAVRITEDEAGNPWRCWAGDGTVSDGDWAELLRGISESTAWTPLSAVWSYSPFTTWTVGKGDIESVPLPSSSHLWGLDVYLPLPGTSWPCLTSFCSNGLKNLSFSYSKPQISSLSYLPAGLGGL